MIYFIDGFSETSNHVVDNIVFENFKFFYNEKIFIFNKSKIESKYIPNELIKIFSDEKQKKRNTFTVIDPDEKDLFMRDKIKFNDERKRLLSEIKEKSKTKDVYVYYHCDTFSIDFLKKQFKNIEFIRYITNPFTSKTYKEDIMDTLLFLIKFNDSRIKTIYNNTSFEQCKKYFYQNKHAWENNAFEVKEITYH